MGGVFASFFVRFIVRVCIEACTITHMRLSQWFSKASEAKQNTFILGVVALVGFVCLSVFFFLNNPGVPLGWLLGSVIEIVAYITIVKGASFLLDPSSLNRNKGYLAPLFMFVRLGLYTGGLVLAAFASFSWGSLESSYLNFFAVFAAYMPMVVVLIFTTVYRLKKSQASAPKKDENKEGEEND